MRKGGMMKRIEIPEEVILAKKKIQNKTKPPKNFLLKELLKIFHIIQCAKDKMSERDPNFERSTSACQGLERNDCSVS